MATKQQGFGCMGLSAFYTSAYTTSEEDKIRVFHAAVDLGITLFNSATFYGELNEVGYGENLRLIKKCLFGIDRSKIKLMVKIGMDTRCPIEKTGSSWIMRGTPEELMADVDFALQSLGEDYLDIAILCRLPPNVPFEDVMRGLNALLDSGKVKEVGVSEFSAENIRKAKELCPITYIEQEWSLWTRDIEEEIVPTCRELGIKIVAYSPLGRGFLSGKLKLEELNNNDYRRYGQPRLAQDNIDENNKLLQALEEFASRKNITVGKPSLLRNIKLLFQCVCFLNITPHYKKSLLRTLKFCLAIIVTI